MSGLDILLAKTFDPAKHDPTGWWMSEKLDGVRAIWNGRAFLSRLGNKFPVPREIVDSMPPGMQIDGELWAGRGNFQDAVSIVKNASEDRGWHKITYRIFDLPKLNEPFEARQKALREYDNRGFMRAVKQNECRGLKHLTDTLKALESRGGEGIMLREPESFYEHKRSSTLLKVKTFLDAEARVIGYTPGQGKHRGRLGALVCETKRGIVFEIGTGLTDYEREHPPRKGSWITFRYQELTRSGNPRFPVFVSNRNYE